MRQGLLARVGSVTTIGSRQSVTIGPRVGGGSQGDVYAASMGSQRVAVKWYHPQYVALDRPLRPRLQRLIAEGPPSPRFVWPLDLVEQPGVAGFGYVMAFIDAPSVSLGALLRGKADPSFRALATVGYEIAKGFLDLHARGFCYCDINVGNVWFDPETGDALICDNDNVDVDGAIGAIAGSPRFMAPEIVRGESGPSIATDLHSLAVLLFWMLTMHHPLVGRQEYEMRLPGPQEDLQLFGTAPTFIFDPADDRNAPVPGAQDVPLIYWPLYPAFLRTLFTQAFTRGLHDPNARVMESAWRRAMARLRDCILACSACGAETFHDPDAAPGSAPPCWQCGAARAPLLTLKVGRTDVAMAADAALFAHHLLPGHEFDFSRPLARVIAHKTRPGLLGLSNLMAEDWLVTNAHGTKIVATNQTVQVETGLAIDFGPVQGVVDLQ